jgi:energy coupling factor transporter S component ThiW
MLSNSNLISGKIAATTVLAAAAIVLSPFSFPVGPTKVYPGQHMINSISGVLLGPWYAIFVAIITGIVRNVFGTGTIFAFPGGIPGAAVVGIVHRYIWKKNYAALTEPIGTAFGAIISALLVSPMTLNLNLSTVTLPMEAFIIAFLISSIPGSILGFIILMVLSKRSKRMNL